MIGNICEFCSKEAKVRADIGTRDHALCDHCYKTFQELYTDEHWGCEIFDE